MKSKITVPKTFTYDFDKKNMYEIIFLNEHGVSCVGFAIRPLAFTDDWFGVTTSNIMPFDSVSVEVVEDGQAILASTFTIVRLGTLSSSSV